MVKKTCHLVAAGTRISCQTKTATAKSAPQQQTAILMPAFRSSRRISDRYNPRQKLVPVLILHVPEPLSGLRGIQCSFMVYLNTAPVERLPADAGFPCDKYVMIGDMIKGTH
jgi:thiosulfate reductase cytochrome b subunit